MISISVCMAMYNASQYLRECIDSILQQTFTDFELLIVDDGSTDDSCEIVRSYDDSRIRLIENNHDYIGSLNLLLKEAKGKYIAKMDADDIMLPFRLEKQFMYMEEHLSIDIIGCSAVKYSPYKEEDFIITRNEKCITPQDLLIANCIIHPTAFLRTDSIRKNNLLYEYDYIYAEDYRLWTRCLICGLNIRVLPDIVLKYRISQNQVSSIHSAIMSVKSEQIQLALGEWICQINNSDYCHPPIIKASSNKLTVIIPFLNEGEEVSRTVESLRRFVGSRIDIIVINDCSTDNYRYKESLKQFNVYYIVNKKRMGVAASRDYGVRLCKTPYFLLLDAHMRVYENDWLDTIIRLLDSDDRQLLCMQTKVLHKSDDGHITEALKEEVGISYGAYQPFNTSSYFPDIAWNMNERSPGDEVELIATVLGAGYAASKRYWMYIKGLNGLIYYGSDEAYISMKVWMEGGKCVLLKKHHFGHIYRNVSPYKHYNDKNIYNCLLIAETLYPLNYRSWAFAIACLKDKEVYNKACNLLKKNAKKITKLCSYYNSIFTKSFYDILQLHQYCEKQNIAKIISRERLFSDVFDYIIHNVNTEYGIFHGIAGEVIWLIHYEKSVQKDLSSFWEPLLDKIDDAVLSERLPVNFAHGICGIGWMYLYLVSNKLLPFLNEDIIRHIDRQIELIDISKLKDFSFGVGVGGILCYVQARINCRLDLEYRFSNRYLNKLKQCAQQAIKYSNDIFTLYNAFKFINSYKSINKDKICLTDCLEFPRSLSDNVKYWKSGMTEGCIGYTIQALLTKMPSFSC